MANTRNITGHYAASGGGSSPPTGTTVEEVYSGTSFSTTSATDVLITSMTITPAAADYIVDFTFCYETTGTADCVFSIYVDGVQDAETDWHFTKPGTAGNQWQAILPCHVTANGSQAVEARVRQLVSGTVTVYNRRLRLIEVA